MSFSSFLSLVGFLVPCSVLCLIGIAWSTPQLEVPVRMTVDRISVLLLAVVVAVVVAIASANANAKRNPYLSSSALQAKLKSSSNNNKRRPQNGNRNRNENSNRNAKSLSPSDFTVFHPNAQTCYLDGADGSTVMLNLNGTSWPLPACKDSGMICGTLRWRGHSRSHFRCSLFVRLFWCLTPANHVGASGNRVGTHTCILHLHLQWHLHQPT